jgi:hypothetical protein
MVQKAATRLPVGCLPPSLEEGAVSVFGPDGFPSFGAGFFLAVSCFSRGADSFTAAEGGGAGAGLACATPGGGNSVWVMMPFGCWAISHPLTSATIMQRTIYAFSMKAKVS